MLACVHAKLLQLCLPLCEPMDCSSPGFSVHRMLQAGILEWVAIPFSRDLTDPRTEPASLVSPALAGEFFTSSHWEAHVLTLQFSSVTQLCPTLCDPMDCSTPGLPVHHQLQGLPQTHVPTISSSVVPFASGLQIFPALGYFPMSQFFTSGGQSIGVSASASVLPLNIKD